MGGLSTAHVVGALAFVAMAVAALRVPAQELSVFDLVDECDLLAAHPADPDRMAEGVADDAIVPRLAILACENALESDPDEPRFAFQLGRALLAMGRKQEAFETFQIAAQAGHAAAYGYLGDAYQFGLGVKADAAKALESYKTALNKGFEAAKDQIEQLTFDVSIYVNYLIKNVYDGDLNALRSNSDAFIRNHLFNFSQSMMQECGSFLTPKGVVGLFFYRYPPGWTIQKD